MKNSFLCFYVNLASPSGKQFRPMSSIIEECSSNQSLNSLKSEKTLDLNFNISSSTGVSRNSRMTLSNADLDSKGSFEKNLLASILVNNGI